MHTVTYSVSQGGAYFQCSRFFKSCFPSRGKEFPQLQRGKLLEGLPVVKISRIDSTPKQFDKTRINMNRSKYQHTIFCFLKSTLKTNDAKVSMRFFEPLKRCQDVTCKLKHAVGLPAPRLFRNLVGVKLGWRPPCGRGRTPQIDFNRSLIHRMSSWCPPGSFLKDRT